MGKRGQLMENQSAGSLLIFNLNQEEVDILVDSLTVINPKLNADLIQLIFQDRFLMYLDAMAGQQVRYPKREYLSNLISSVKIYLYCKKRNNTESSVSSAAIIFKKKPQAVKDICTKIENYIKQVKEK